MRHDSIVRIAVPRKQAPPPKPDPAVALLDLLDLCETRLLPLLDQSTSNRLSSGEARVLMALPSRKPILARDLGAGLGMDQGHLSRILRELALKGLIARQEAEDRRQSPLVLTATGRLERLHAGRRKKQALSALLQALSREKWTALARATAEMVALLRSATDQDGPVKP